MAMFAKDKPTKRIEFEGGWVELQYLSKGVKNEIAGRLSAMFAGVDEGTLKNLDNNEHMPVTMIGAVSKIQEVEYYKLSKAIKAWSAQDTQISEETVRDLDNNVFDKISDEVNKMNELSETERKN